MVSLEVEGAESDEAAVAAEAVMGARARISLLSPAGVVAIAAGDGVIVSDDGAEIAVATGGGSSGGGAEILACVAGMLPSLFTSEEAEVELLSLCPLSSDGTIAAFEVTASAYSVADVGEGGREGAVARDSDWG